MQTRIDWEQISTVLLDMDGTLLDLNFDNWFWSELVPRHYGLRHGLSPDEVATRLKPEFESRRGTLEWYCLDFWARHLDLDLRSLKHNSSHRIRFLPGATRFLTRVRTMGKRRVLVTNAHEEILRLKLAITGLGDYFDAVYSSHQFGLPKEQAGFWERLQAVEDFDRERSVFADDSLPVLVAARAYGIRHVIGMRRPDSGGPSRALEGFPSVETILDLLGD